MDLDSVRSFIVVDLEATCDDQGAVPRHEMEIIEIGAVLVTASALQVEDEFQAFVKPVRHPVLTRFCRELTSIAQTYPMPSPHLNLKRLFSETRNLRKKLGVGQALRAVGLEFEGTAHRGIDDARNIARLLPYALGRR